MIAHILIIGEADVGIPDHYIRVDLGFKPNDTDEEAFIENCLYDCFSKICGMPLTISFEETEDTENDNIVRQFDGI